MNAIVDEDGDPSVRRDRRNGLPAALPNIMMDGYYKNPEASWSASRKYVVPFAIS